MDFLLGPLFIFCLRICDVSLGTLRTMFTVQSKKWLASGIGFVEVMIWVVAIRQIFTQLDNVWNVLGYGAGFATGTFIGIVLEEKIAIGFLQAFIISRHHADAIADALRAGGFGVTLVPAEGGSGGMAIITVVLRRSMMRRFREIVDGIDHEAFLSFQRADLHRGFVHGSRK
jgi:uncharacterized protein YebE (UPF0316 family)